MFCSRGFAQPTQLNKKQIPAATVFSDQANTFSAGDQDFGSTLSLKIKTGAGAPLAILDCNTAGESGTRVCALKCARVERNFLCLRQYGFRGRMDGSWQRPRNRPAGGRHPGGDAIDRAEHYPGGQGISPVTANDTGSRIV